ncbi:YciI family protein [Paraburkholderia hospita]|uniref:YciI family protein n=1 Tax=Paraburkholderia hospita TaxID=169430 RepID=UPI0009A583F8|nr:YciI family protein [Paraburkholderia hospita]SKC83634.1 hypothetical protein SAMN05445504_3692 [Burkholderia sp. CF099]SKC93368.1 hypothetical protein SAMN05446934_6546 [Paraburkholderia hospita]
MASNVRERLAGLLGLPLFAILSSDVEDPQVLEPHLNDHLDYMIGLEKRGLLFGSGPFKNSRGHLTGGGLTIVRAPTFEDARRLAEQDPFVKNGLRTFDVRSWTLSEGSLTLTINFSDQSVKVV